MERRDPLLGLGGLSTLIGLLVFGWAVRPQPHPANDACSYPAVDPVRDAWLVGLAPAAFVTACGCAYLALWTSAAGARERPRTRSIVLVAIVLVLGLQWWVEGEGSPVASWALATLLGLLISPVVVPALIGGVLWFRHKRRGVWAWRSLRLLCWWSLLILIPAFVVLVNLWAADLYC